MLSDVFWHMFEQSGDINAYLAYKDKGYYFTDLTAAAAEDHERYSKGTRRNESGGMA